MLSSVDKGLINGRKGDGNLAPDHFLSSGVSAMNKKVTPVIAVSMLMLASAHASAADWSGKAFYRPISQETVELSDGRTFIRSGVAGYVSGDGAGNPFDMLYQTCSSTTIVAPNDGGMEQFGYCDALDANQNLFVISFHDNEWRIEGGTGTFAGMKGGGTTKNLHTWPDGSYLISWSGTTAR